MAFVSTATPLPLLKKPIFLNPSTSVLLHSPSHPSPRACALKTAVSVGGGRDLCGRNLGVNAKVSLLEEELVGSREGVSGEGGELVDWEDQILEETVPLVNFVRTILHSSKYKSGDRLNPDHEEVILEKLLPYHPSYEMKIGCGVDYITVDYHPDFESTRCLFITRRDGESIDFSYWKCIKGFIRKNHPLYADTFILRHFGRRRRRI